MKKFLLGCCYYPSHWEDADMPKDLARIKDLGFNCIRMGEFDWSMFEKEEGKYDFSLLSAAVSRAAELGIDVILGTPTAAPPKWLVDKHPEVLCVSANGTVMQHGSRQHHNHTSEIYLKYCAAITEAMVKHFCGCKNVIGWQIDNELNCHRNESYAETDDAAFRVWLEKKYGTVEALNKAWGNRFWSLEFNDFSQVTCPRPKPTHSNPAWITDYYLFMSDTVVNFAAVQADILRRYMPDAFITHNGMFANIDYRALTDRCLDFLSYDSYPSFNESNGAGTGRKVAYKFASMRDFSKEFLVLEQQSGPGGQLSYLLPTPRPGQIRLWTYQSIANGAAGVLYFRYRTALYGAEQLWYGIYDHDGEENYRSREIRKISEELARVGDLFLRERLHSDVAIWSDYHNTCANKVESFAKGDAWEIFTELNRINIAADMISDPERMEEYKVIVFPHVVVADEALAEAVRRFTDRGGIAVISARSGMKDRNVQYRPTKAPGVFRELAGCRVDWFTAVPAYEDQRIRFEGREYPVDTYYEMLAPEGGECVGTYTDGFCKDKSGIVKCGNVYYIGAYFHKAPELYAEIVKKYVGHRDPVDPDVEEVRLGEHTMYLNHSDRAVPLAGYDILEEKSFEEIPAYGVVLLREEK
ncbi:MAG: beta-galactosidase [Clostridia bacterium]|nr:beta-galactosidase [Clostridia bacterium]